MLDNRGAVGARRSAYSYLHITRLFSSAITNGPSCAVMSRRTKPTTAE